MSTKLPSEVGDDFCLYEECFEDGVFLDIEDISTFQIDKSGRVTSLTVKLPDEFVTKCIKDEVKDKMRNW